eukprot:8014122-Lingulodinium_polyedra.AAC.1
MIDPNTGHSTGKKNSWSPTRLGDGYTSTRDALAPGDNRGLAQRPLPPLRGLLPPCPGGDAQRAAKRRC